MYVEQRPEGFVCDREAIATWLGRTVNTVRKYCRPTDRTRGGTPLYNFDHCEYVLSRIPERRARRVDTRSA